MAHAQREAGDCTDDASLLVLLVETNPTFWDAGAPREESVRSSGFAAFLEQLLVFVQAYLLLNVQNKLAVIALHGDGCHFLYDSLEGDDGGGDAAYEFTGTAGEIIVRRAQQLLTPAAAAGDAPPLQPSPLSGALSQALCYVHRATAGAATQQPRILCLHGSPDHPPQYIAVMNSIFSAQADRVPIDACLLGSQESPFLQQAANLTDGICLRPARADGLLQYLLTVFACDLFSRRFLRLPQAAGVDFRASCFCHKRTIDVGYVCSVCLSIFCAVQRECTTCGTEFAVVKRK